MITLKPYNQQIAQQLSDYRNNPIIFKNGYENAPKPFTLKDANDYIKLQLAKNPAHRKLIYWDNQFAGEIGITIKDDVFRFTAELGYFVAEPFWGKGIATKAIQIMVD